MSLKGKNVELVVVQNADNGEVEVRAFEDLVDAMANAFNTLYASLPARFRPTFDRQLERAERMRHLEEEDELLVLEEDFDLLNSFIQKNIPEHPISVGQMNSEIK